MNLQMSSQVGLLRKPLVAELAQKSLLARMHQKVLLQLALGGKRFPAHFAVEVLLACVYFDVSGQVAGTGKPGKFQSQSSS